MNVEKSPEVSLSTLYACLNNARKAVPELTLTGLLALLFIGRETGARDWRRIPTERFEKRAGFA